jgi:glucose uptake protein GlcU
LVKAIKILIEIIGWLAIAGGTTLGAALISFIFYSKWGNETIALAILIVGFIIGAIWATRISIKYGTMEWLSQIRRIS